MEPSELTSLPAVARNIFIHCSKCGVDRYFKVLAHTSSSKAKCECEVCKSKKSYSLSKRKVSKASTSLNSSNSTISSTGKTTNSKKSAKEEMSQQRQLWNNAIQQMSANSSRSYDMKVAFQVNEVIKHTSFGFGLIQQTYPQKISVLFETGIKELVHNRA